MEMIFKGFLQYGAVGLVAIIAMFVAWKKDQELKAERDGRLADAKEYLKLYYDLTKDWEATMESAVNLVLRPGNQNKE